MRVCLFTVVMTLAASIVPTTIAAGKYTLEIHFDKATFRPGQTVAFEVVASPAGAGGTVDTSPKGAGGTEVAAGAEQGPGAVSHDPGTASTALTLHVTIWRLAQEVARLTSTIEEGEAHRVIRRRFAWEPPPADAGYGVEAWIEGGPGDGSDPILGCTESAFDVAADWTSQPRYGFYSEFSRWDEEAERAAIAKMSRLHINGVQFYDWQYRHDTLVPPAEGFVDSLGRPLLASTIEKKIALTRERGMAPMAYTAIYAASPGFHARHPEWGLYTWDGKPIDFGDGYLYLMDPTRGAGWDAHLIEEFKRVLRRFDFQGIHVDQYGYPKAAYNRSGGTVFVARAFRTFLDDAKAALLDEFDRNALTFNSVTNWPAAVVAKSAYDFNYIEVWPPYVTYGDIERIIQDAYANSGGNATVIAAYVDPENEATVRLLNAFIFANGGTHIEIGEGDGMLADPYFPKFRRVSPTLWQALVAAYDLIVRYREWLYGPRTPLEATERVTVDGEKAPLRPTPGKVHAVLHALADGAGHTLSLINLTGAQSAAWSEAQEEPPRLAGLTVRVRLDRAPTGVYVISPDADTIRPLPLPFSTVQTGSDVTVELTLPELHYWSLLVFES